VIMSPFPASVNAAQRAHRPAASDCMQDTAADSDSAAAGTGGDAGRALEERGRVQRLLQAAQDGELEALKVEPCLACEGVSVPAAVVCNVRYGCIQFCMLVRGLLVP
jgi:hypothetical protein